MAITLDYILHIRNSCDCNHSVFMRSIYSHDVVLIRDDIIRGDVIRGDVTSHEVTSRRAEQSLNHFL